MQGMSGAGPGFQMAIIQQHQQGSNAAMLHHGFTACTTAKHQNQNPAGVAGLSACSSLAKLIIHLTASRVCKAGACIEIHDYIAVCQTCWLFGV